MSSVVALVALSTLAHAQPAFECKATETQAECHTRLRCKPDEELEACQKRLRNAAQQGNANQDQRGDDRGADDRGRDRDPGDDEERDRGRDRGRDRDDDRGRGRDRDDDARGRRHRGRDRGDGGRRRGSRGGTSGFAANKTFGLGLELGEPSGLTGKYFLSDALALDFGLGAIYSHYYYGDGVHLYGDLLWHPVSLVSASAFELPFYVGGGLRFWSFEYCDRQICGYDGSALGIRVPLGIAFDFNNVPLDIFIQLVPVIDFLNGDYYDRYRDRTHLGIDLSVGIRYWFK